jgi:hypothetical protein
MKSKRQIQAEKDHQLVKSLYRQGYDQNTLSAVACKIWVGNTAIDNLWIGNCPLPEELRKRLERFSHLPKNVQHGIQHPRKRGDTPSYDDVVGKNNAIKAGFLPPIER